MWRIVVTEIPYQVQKSRLIERIAELLEARKLPLLDDVRDESADDVRLVLVPKSRNVDPDVLMASLFQSCDLEIKFPMNMNVLGKDNVPRVMNLREVLRAFLDHRHEVLVRRCAYRVGKIDHRLEVLSGYLIAYLNLDEVIRVIREEDEPKTELKTRFALTDIQADAVLDMRLRNLRKLEEMEIRKEHDALSSERAGLAELLADDGKRWARIADEIATMKRRFGGGDLGRRRTDIGDAPTVIEVPVEAVIERESVTVLLSSKGWIRAARGHLGEAERADVKYKEGDGEGFFVQCETTDKILLFASNGKVFTLPADKPQRGRGFGEPVRLMFDLPNDADIVTMFKHDPTVRRLVASDDGRGFLVEETEIVAQTRSGKQVLVLDEGRAAKLCVPAAGDTVAVIGNHRKLLVFPIDQLPTMGRGKGVQLQKYKDANPVRRQGLFRGGRSDMAIGRPQHVRQGLDRLARRPRRRGQDAAERVPEEQQVLRGTTRITRMEVRSTDREGRRNRVSHFLRRDGDRFDVVARCGGGAVGGRAAAAGGGGLRGHRGLAGAKGDRGGGCRLSGLRGGRAVSFRRRRPHLLLGGGRRGDPRRHADRRGRQGRSRRHRGGSRRFGVPDRLGNPARSVDRLHRQAGVARVRLRAGADHRSAANPDDRRGFDRRTQPPAFRSRPRLLNRGVEGAGDPRGRRRVDRSVPRQTKARAAGGLAGGDRRLGPLVSPRSRRTRIAGGGNHRSVLDVAPTARSLMGDVDAIGGIVAAP